VPAYTTSPSTVLPSTASKAPADWHHADPQRPSLDQPGS
jgi:hypothetical protein